MCVDCVSLGFSAGDLSSCDVIRIGALLGRAGPRPLLFQQRNPMVRLLVRGHGRGLNVLTTARENLKGAAWLEMDGKVFICQHPKLKTHISIVGVRGRKLAFSHVLRHVTLPSQPIRARATKHQMHETSSESFVESVNADCILSNWRKKPDVVGLVQCEKGSRCVFAYICQPLSSTISLL